MTISGAQGKEEADGDDGTDEDHEGAEPEHGEESILPFEIWSEVVGVGGPEFDSQEGTGGGEEGREADQQISKQAGAQVWFVSKMKGVGIPSCLCHISSKPHIMKERL